MEREVVREASQSRDYCVANNATLRAARPGPYFRAKNALSQDDSSHEQRGRSWRNLCLRRIARAKSIPGGVCF